MLHFLQLHAGLIMVGVIGLVLTWAIVDTIEMIKGYNPPSDWNDHV